MQAKDDGVPWLKVRGNTRGQHIKEILQNFEAGQVFDNILKEFVELEMKLEFDMLWKSIGKMSGLRE